jgi:hypothetical protein
MLNFTKTIWAVRNYQKIKMYQELFHALSGFYFRFII